MPELPEVETLILSMKRKKLIGKVFNNIKVLCPNLIATPAFEKNIKNKKILNIYRRGKYIIFSLSWGYSLLVHLKMTGHFFYKQKQENSSYEHIQFFLDNGSILSFNDMRKFAKLYLTKNPEKYLSSLGREPLDKKFSIEEFLEKIKISKRKIKSLLLDQSFIAGIGNIYVDEALWEAKIHPRKIAKNLSKKKSIKLFEAIKKVLHKGIKHKGTSLGKNAFNFCDINKNFGNNQFYLNAYMQKDKPCKRCSLSNIMKIKVNQRSSYFCPNCQS